MARRRSRLCVLLASLLLVGGCGDEKLYDLYIDRAPGVQEHHAITDRAELDRIGQRLLAEIRDGQLVLGPDGSTPAIQAVYTSTEGELEAQTRAGTHRIATTTRIASPRFVFHAPGSAGEWPVSADLAEDDGSWQRHTSGELAFVLRESLDRIHQAMVIMREPPGAQVSEP